MFIGEHPYQSALRYSGQKQQNTQNELNQPFFENHLSQNIMDINRNYIFQNSSFSSLNNSLNRTNNSLSSNLSQFSFSSFNEQFHNKLSYIESRNKENTDNISNIENASQTISNEIITTNQSIQQLRTQIEKFSSFQINSILQPSSDQNKSNKSSIESLSSTFRSSNIHPINSSINELSTSFLIFNDKFDSISNNLNKNEFPSLKRDTNKISAIYKTNSTKTDKLETLIDSKIINDCVQKEQLFESVNINASQNFELFQNTENLEIQSITKELSEGVKLLSNDRNKLIILHSKQIESIQNKVKNSLLKYDSILKEMKRDNLSSINELKESIKNLLNASQDDCSEMLLQLNNQCDSLVSESENNFNVLHSEIADTMNCIRENNENEISSMLTVIETESKIQKKNFLLFNDSIDNFLNTFNDEIQLNFKKCQKKFKKIEKDGFRYFDSNFEDKIKPGFQPLKDLESRLDFFEKRIVDCENSLSNIVSEMKITVDQTNDKIKEIFQLVEDSQIIEKDQINLIDTELRKIEIKNNQLLNESRLSSNEYVKKIQKKTIEIFEKKTFEFEKKFNIISSYLHSVNLLDSKTETSYEAKVDSKPKITSVMNSNDIDNDFSLTDENNFPTNNESDNQSEDETYSTLTLLENTQHNLIQKIKNDQEATQNQDAKNDQQKNQKSSEPWDLSSDSEADDEATEEFTFNNKTLNNEKKS